MIVFFVVDYNREFVTTEFVTTKFELKNLFVTTEFFITEFELKNVFVTTEFIVPSVCLWPIPFHTNTIAVRYIFFQTLSSAK